MLLFVDALAVAKILYFQNVGVMKTWAKNGAKDVNLQLFGRNA